MKKHNPFTIRKICISCNGGGIVETGFEVFGRCKDCNGSGIDYSQPETIWEPSTIEKPLEGEEIIGSVVNIPNIEMQPSKGITILFEAVWNSAIDECVKVLQLNKKEADKKLESEHDKNISDILSYEGAVSNNIKMIMAYHSTQLEELIDKLNSLRK